MRYETIIRRKLAEAFSKYVDDLSPSFVVEPQAVIKLTPARKFETSEWKMITERVEDMHGCWEHSERIWKIPLFLSRINLPPSDEKPNEKRLHIRSLTLRNVVFLHDIFANRSPVSWRDIQKALSYSQQKRSGGRNTYSKAACRDYLSALLALETR